MSRGVHWNSDVGGTSVELDQPLVFSLLEGYAKPEGGPSSLRAAWWVKKGYFAKVTTKQTDLSCFADVV